MQWSETMRNGAGQRPTLDIPKQRCQLAPFPRVAGLDLEWRSISGSIYMVSKSAMSENIGTEAGQSYRWARVRKGREAHTHS